MTTEIDGPVVSASRTEGGGVSIGGGLLSFSTLGRMMSLPSGLETTKGSTGVSLVSDDGVCGFLFFTSVGALDGVFQVWSLTQLYFVGFFTYRVPCRLTPFKGQDRDERVSGRDHLRTGATCRFVK